MLKAAVDGCKKLSIGSSDSDFSYSEEENEFIDDSEDEEFVASEEEEFEPWRWKGQAYKCKFLFSLSHVYLSKNTHLVLYVTYVFNWNYKSDFQYQIRILM